MNISKNIVPIFILIFLLTQAKVRAQKLNAGQQLELQKTVQNKLAHVLSIPFQNNFDLGYGPKHQLRYVMNFQPSIPIRLKNHALLIAKPIVPVINSPWPKNVFGLGDINANLAYAPKPRNQHFVIGAGIALGIPTATDKTLGNGKWLLGPSLVFAKTSRKFVVGSLINQTWSVAGASGRKEVSSMLWQLYTNYNLKNGYSLAYSPNITANWKGSRGNKLTLPLGIGVSKTEPLKKGRALTLNVQYFYNVVRPANGPHQSWRFQANYVIPK